MSNKQMTASTSVRIRMDDVKVFGPGIAELLERIDRCESIRTATMEMPGPCCAAVRLLSAIR